MKRTLLSLIASVLTLSASAQLREDAFIIRTTDGAAQGLLFCDVEKITFSNLDEEGVPHTGVYYQELHYPDTIIRVPVSEIEEVSFEKPSIKYQPNVVLGKETGLFDYLYSVTETETGFNLVFKYDTPEELWPQVGQVLTYLGGDIRALDNQAFAGRVKDIYRVDMMRVMVETEMIESITDIYEELIGVEAVGNDSPGVRESLRKANALPKDDDMAKAPIMREVSGGGTIPKIDFDINRDFKWDEDCKFSITGGVKGSIELRLAYEFGKKRTFLSVGSTYEYTPHFSFDFTADTDWEKMFWDPIIQPAIQVTAPSAPIFTIYFGMSPFIKTAGKASVSFGMTLPTTKTRSLSYFLDGIYRSGKCAVNDPADQGLDNSTSLNLSLNLEGSCHAGMALGLYVGTTRICKSTIGIGADMYIGPKLTGTFNLPISIPSGTVEGPNTDAYALLRSCNVSANWCTMDMTLYYFREFVSRTQKTKIAEASFDVLDPVNLSFVPDFEIPQMTLYDKTDFEDWATEWRSYRPLKITMGKPDGYSFVPLSPGFAVYDENDKFVRQGYFTGKQYSYSTKDDPVFENMEFKDFLDWEPNTKYKIYPAFSFYLPGAKTPTYVRCDEGREVTINGSVQTGSAEFDKENKTMRLYGSIDPAVRMSAKMTTGIAYSTNRADIETRPYVQSVEPIKPYDTTFYLQTGYSPGATYYYRTVAKTGDHYIMGDIHSVTAPKDDDEE